MSESTEKRDSRAALAWARMDAERLRDQLNPAPSDAEFGPLTYLKRLLRTLPLVPESGRGGYFFHDSVERLRKAASVAAGSGTLKARYLETIDVATRLYAWDTYAGIDLFGGLIGECLRLGDLESANDVAQAEEEVTGVKARRYTERHLAGAVLAEQAAR